MHILRLIAEGVGPFEKLDLDLSDGHGKPHLGPHILAGVNGSGKSTALRTIAWVLSYSGFPEQEWRHLLSGHQSSRALLSLKNPAGRPRVQARPSKMEPMNVYPELERWVNSVISSVPGESQHFVHQHRVSSSPPGVAPVVTFGDWTESDRNETVAAAYAPSRELKFLSNPDLNEAPADYRENALAFDGTVRNAKVQSWITGLFSKRALAKENSESAELYERFIGSFQSALRSIYGDESITLGVTRDPAVRPYLSMRGHRLNFSQLPDGVRTVLGWLADFMSRQYFASLVEPSHGEPDGILLIDEIDAHLHPRWQRQILPALRKALPTVQIIVASHSPFVINSCQGARVHVLEVDDTGHARARPPVDAPFGQSINAALSDIFGVDSRFDIETESDLGKWNELKRLEAVERLSPAEGTTLGKLTEELSQRSEELQFLVGTPSELTAKIHLPPRNTRTKQPRSPAPKTAR